MRIVRCLFLLVGLAGIAALGGCSAVGKMPIEFDDYARSLQPDQDNALVYVLRPTGYGKISLFTVTCDGDSIGATGGGRYIYTMQKPGPHLFISKAENKSELPIVLEAGETYYLEQKVKMGLFSARNNLERLSDEEGIEKLAKCSLSEEITAIIPGAEAYMAEKRAQKQERLDSTEIGEM